MVRGAGVYLWDEQGQKYLDFTAGIAVCSLGHAHPRLAAVLTEQAATLIHCSNLYQNPWQNQLAERLAGLSGLDKAFFCNSGAEANEAALKIARRYFAQQADRRTEVISLPGAFHGRTMGALSITPKPKYHEGFTPLVPDCHTPATLAEVPGAISERTAACFVEVIQGEGGVHPVPLDVLQAIQQRCRETGTLLVVDEVQTGVGRTGTMFAFEQAGLQPDIVTLAKGLAGGVPIGAVLVREQVAGVMGAGSHGSTFGGNPLACAAALCVLDELAADGFLARVKAVGQYLGERLQELGSEVSGRGLMWGITVPDAQAFVRAAAAAGVLVTAVGDQRVRFVPPLILEREHVDELLDRLQALRVSGGR
ncbi:MAG: acetylornithine/succinylornithine family transaminase [Alicyclobacillus sp.]|nr:acetylornithine/succinylornithine family transaminase [Alicyclobacillus sp.]